MMEIEWKTRENGVKPKNSNYSSEEVRLFDKDLLLDFYESKLKFVDGKKKINNVESNTNYN